MAALETNKLSEVEQVHRRSRANLLLMEEMEMDRDVMSTSLIFAVLVASLSQFLVGYNTGCMNAHSFSNAHSRFVASFSLVVLLLFIIK